MPVLTAEQVGAYWILGGGPRHVTAEAISQAYVESGFDTNAVSSAGYTGLWQDGQDPALKDPLKNARAAVAKWRDGGNSFRKHWTNFQAPGTEAKRIAYMPRASIAAARVQGKNLARLRAIVGTTNAGLSLPDIPNPLDALPDLTPNVPNPGDVLGAVGNIAEVLKGFLSTWLELLKKIIDPNTWKDLGKIWLGFLLLIIGLRRIVRVT